MESISACSKSALDEIYQWLVDCNFRVEDQELVMFTIALLKVMGREGRGNRSTEAVLMLAFSESRTAKKGRNTVVRYRRGEMSGHDLASWLGLGEQSDFRLGDMPMPVSRQFLCAVSLRIEEITRWLGPIVFCGLNNFCSTIEESEHE